MKVTSLYMFATGLVFAFFGKGLIRIFFSEEPGVIAMGHTLLILAAIFQAFDAVNIVILGALRGAGDTLRVAIITFVFAYVFFLPLSMALAFWAGWGAVGAWIGATAYIIGLSGILYLRFRGGGWKEIRIFSREAQPSAYSS
jgi:MATE family multidrug resistance protein